MNLEPKIWQATTDDAKKLIRYLQDFRGAGDDTVFHRASVPTEEEEVEWLEARNGENAVCFLALLEERVIGIIDAAIPQRTELRHTCELGLSVLGEFRNQGVGSALLDTLTQWALAKSVLRLELSVFSHNTPAIFLYNQKGFIEEGRLVGQIRLPSSRHVDRVLMVKHLPQKVEQGILTSGQKKNSIRMLPFKRSYTVSAVILSVLAAICVIGGIGSGGFGVGMTMIPLSVAALALCPIFWRGGILANPRLSISIYKWLNRRSQRKSFTVTSFADAWQRWKIPMPRVIEKPWPQIARQGQPGPV